MAIAIARLPALPPPPPPPMSHPSPRTADILTEDYGELSGRGSWLTADLLMKEFVELEDRIAVILASGMDPSDAERELEIVGRELDRLKEVLAAVKQKQDEA